MRREKSQKRHNSTWKNTNHRERENDGHGIRREKKPLFKPTIKSVSPEQIREDEDAIKEFKALNQKICSVCGLPLKDLSTAFDADDGQNFMHFDCVMNRVAEKETLEPGDKIAYIGQGRFGVVHYANIHDTRHFSIKKIIEWDDKEKKSEWREEMADLYSRVK